jgi:hypothetical protein
MVLETSVLSIFNQLTRLEARENFINFSRRESFKSYITYIIGIRKLQWIWERNAVKIAATSIIVYFYTSSSINFVQLIERLVFLQKSFSELVCAFRIVLGEMRYSNLSPMGSFCKPSQSAVCGLSEVRPHHEQCRVSSLRPRYESQNSFHLFIVGLVVLKS